MNIAESFVKISRENEDRTGLVEANSGKQINFGGLNKLADSYAYYFKEKGVKPGDIIILMVTPSIDFIALTLALFKLGSPIVLIDPGMGYKNLLRCIQRVKPKYLIGIPKAVLFAKIFRFHFKTVEKFFCCGPSFFILGENIKKKLMQSADHFPVYSPGKDDLAAIIFTTGSTGPPKGVCYEHSIFSTQLELIRNYYKIGIKDIDQPAFPLFALFATALGASAIIPDMDATKPAQVDPEKFVSSIQEFGVSYSFGSPAIWNVVSRYCLENNIKLESVKKILMAGAPVPYELLKRVRNILPADADIYTPYGATESLPIVSIEAREILNETWEQSRVGKGTCVGKALPGIEIRIIEISDEPIDSIEKVRFLENKEIGEIIVRGAVVTKAYYNNDKETKLAKIRDGDSFWHRIGDVGYLDQQERLWFCGRRAHRVVGSEQTYFSVPCEAIVNEHSDVYRSALVAVKNNTGATVPALLVEPVTGFTGSETELLKEVRDLANASQLTETITHFLVHPDFPVDIRHNAKIFREKLAIWAQKKLYPSQ